MFAIIKKIIQYKGQLYIIHDMINYTRYESVIKDIVYYVSNVSGLPNTIEISLNSYDKIHLKGDDTLLLEADIKAHYNLSSTIIKDGELCYTYNLIKT